MKIDIHAHILPETWPDLRDRYGYGGFIRLDHDCEGCSAKMMKDDEFFRKVDPNVWSPEVRIDECDEEAVDVQVLSTVPVMFSYWAEPADTHDLSKILNEHIAGVCEKYPKRYAGLGTIPMNDTDRAIQELERCVKQLGLVGVEIGTHINGTNLSADRFDPLWEAAEELDAAIFVHPWDMMGWDQLEEYWMPWLVSMPAETSRAICSLLMGGVLDRYPDLKFAFAHGGGSFPATLGRVDWGFQTRPDLCQVDTETRPVDLVDKLVFDTLVHDPAMLQFLVDNFGADQLALGTDYPFVLGEHHPGQLIESMDFAPETKEQMLSGTALEWMGRKRSDFETEASLKHSESIGCEVSGTV